MRLLWVLPRNDRHPVFLLWFVTFLLALFVICIHTSLTRWRPSLDRAPFVNENCFYKSDARRRLQICASLWHFVCLLFCALLLLLLPSSSSSSCCCWQLCSGINETGEARACAKAGMKKMLCLWPATRRMRDVTSNRCTVCINNCYASVCESVCVSNWITVVLSLYLLPGGSSQTTNSSCHFSHVVFFFFCSCSSFISLFRITWHFLLSVSIFIYFFFHSLFTPCFMFALCSALVSICLLNLSICLSAHQERSGNSNKNNNEKSGKEEKKVKEQGSTWVWHASAKRVMGRRISIRLDFFQI